MNILNKKIGIWGFGIMGKSTSIFLTKKNMNVTVFDKRVLTDEEIRICASYTIAYTNDLNAFLSTQDIIIPSGGVDLREYKEYHNKIVSELDIFYMFFKKPIIAITGSLGKTTLTTLLALLLEKKGKKVLIGGNIGVGLCDLLEQNEDVDYAVIEVSSFQLEHCKIFAPDLALWTNLYPNHLDRHTTFKEYFNAKHRLVEQQTSKQNLLVSWQLATMQIKTNAQIYYVNETRPKDKNFINVFFEEKNKIYCNDTELFSYQSLMIYKENLIFLLGALYILGIDNKGIEQYLYNQELEHRMEKIIKNNIVFYNDSKSTVMQATIKAINQLLPGTIHLFLGGLSKGVHRNDFIHLLKGKVKTIYCFGKESLMLSNFCMEHAIDSYAFENLDEAFSACMKNIEKKDIILFSPGGSSFDLFVDYKQRGLYFKQLINKL